MDKSKNRDCLNTIKEMILDERKLVTYISVSKELCLHVNESKSLLGEIVENIRNSASADIQLNINYIISGLLEGNKARTVVCNESEIANIKNKFKIVFYQHLYSVSVGKPLADNVSFMAINKFEDFPLCTGLIKSNLCVKRSSAEIGTLKTSSQETASSDQKCNISAPKKVKESGKGVKDASEIKQMVKVAETKSEPVIITKVPTPKKEPITNGLPKPDNKNLKTQKGIAGFFNKPATATTNKTLTSGTKQNAAKNISIKQIKSEIKEPEIKTEKMDVDEVVPKEVNKGKSAVKETERNGNKSLNHIKKNAKVDKKRKRVLHVSDSESDDEKNDPFTEEPIIDQESEDEIPPTPLVNTVKITSGIVNPKKKRKMVDKTYTDEDGYILTKKEEVYECCSENEEEVHVKENIQQVNIVKTQQVNIVKTEVSPPEKKNGKNTKKKIASPQKGKQATLMSFFKKV